MKPNSGSDRIVLALVGVLAIIVLGVVITIIIEAFNPAEQSEIGQQVAVLFSTVAGACVGAAAGYVTHSPPQMPWNRSSSELAPSVPEGTAVVPVDPTPATPQGDAATEVAPLATDGVVDTPVTYGPPAEREETYDDDAYDNVTDQFTGGQS